MATCSGELASRLYNIHRFENNQTEMNLIFRDHTISDLIGFVYSGMPPQDAANHLMRNIRESAHPFLMQGMTRLYPLFSTARMPGNTIPSQGANSCAVSTICCSTNRG